jgi:hypothetical protein
VLLLGWRRLARSILRLRARRTADTATRGRSRSVTGS